MMSLFHDSGETVDNGRQPEYAIDPIFINRWSPRAFDSTPVSEEVVKSLFEAARWSPSCYNEQPWLFLYAVSGEELKLFRSLLVEFNQTWAVNAPVIGFLFARRRFARNDKPNDWAAFDSGAAWMAMTIQARMLGLYTHGMGGFHKDRVYETLGVPEDDYEAVCAFAIGMYGDREALPDDMKKTERPSDRKPLSEVAIRGKFK